MLPLSSASSSASATRGARAIEVEPRDRCAREVVGGARLEILATDLAGDLERLADPALVVVQVAEPPADASPHHQRLVAILGLAVLQENERLLDQVAPARQVGVAHERILGERRQRETLQPLVTRLGRIVEDALHLDGLRRQIGDPARGAGGEEAALQGRPELDRTHEQAPGRVVRLLGERPAAGLLERRSRPRRQLRRCRAVELLVQSRRMVEVEARISTSSSPATLREPVG